MKGFKVCAILVLLAVDSMSAVIADVSHISIDTTPFERGQLPQLSVNIITEHHNLSRLTFYLRQIYQDNIVLEKLDVERHNNDVFVLSGKEVIRDPDAALIVSEYRNAKWLQYSPVSLFMPAVDQPEHQPVGIKTMKSATAVLSTAIPLTTSRKVITAQAPVASTQKPLDHCPITQLADDTLWNIAVRYRTQWDSNIYGAMLALYQTNPSAFYQGKISLLKVGSSLRCPSVALISQFQNVVVDRVTFDNLVASQRDQQSVTSTPTLAVNLPALSHLSDVAATDIDATVTDATATNTRAIDTDVMNTDVDVTNTDIDVTATDTDATNTDIDVMATNTRAIDTDSTVTDATATDTNVMNIDNDVMNTDTDVTVPDATATDTDVMNTKTDTTKTDIDVMNTDIDVTATDIDVMNTDIDTTVTNTRAIDTDSTVTDATATDTNVMNIDNDVMNTDTDVTVPDATATDTNVMNTNNDVTATDMDATVTDATAIDTDVMNTDAASGPIAPDNHAADNQLSASESLALHETPIQQRRTPANKVAKTSLLTSTDIQAHEQDIHCVIDKSPQDTLWKIAEHYARQWQTNIYSAMLAIYDANPNAFASNKIYLLMSDSHLTCPSKGILKQYQSASKAVVTYEALART